MLFNSFSFIFLFVPLSMLVVYSCLFCGQKSLARFALVIASLSFYGYWNPKYVFLIILSVLVNYVIAVTISGSVKRKQRISITFFGVLFNLSLLGFYKYSFFLVSTIGDLTGLSFTFERVVLPLAISFFTFQQIAYLVDCFKTRQAERNLANYMLFVCFFPQLIAGPIVHHREMLPQFSTISRFSGNVEYIKEGFAYFSIGLFKKVCIADTFAIWANKGYATSGELSLVESWTTTLSYTFQLYYDFSGYSDMAIGLGLLFGVRLPQNFYSPYKATNIQAFWRTWHITLSKFLRDYVYIPLGGGKQKTSITMRNVFVTFLLGGIWHGAGWTFVLWGVMHGVGMVVHRLWLMANISLPAIVSWFFTFLFVHLAWVLFRAEEWAVAVKMYCGMIGLNGVGELDFEVAIFLITFSLVAFLLKNSHEIVNTKRTGARTAFYFIAFIMAMLQMLNQMVLEEGASEFLYFEF